MNRTLTIVRHAQASFLSDNYDQLSARGQLQARRLGEHLERQGRNFDLILTGTLRRQQDTAALILESFPEAGRRPEKESLPGLNEFSPSVWDTHGRLLRKESRSFRIAAIKILLARKAGKAYLKGYISCASQILESWSRRDLAGCPTFSDFQAAVFGVHAALPDQGRILIVSSNTPCALLTGKIANKTIEESMQSMLHIYNTAFTIIQQKGATLKMLYENSLEHLPEELRTFI